LHEEEIIHDFFYPHPIQIFRKLLSAMAEGTRIFRDWLIADHFVDVYHIPIFSVEFVVFAFRCHLFPTSSIFFLDMFILYLFQPGDMIPCTMLASVMIAITSEEDVSNLNFFNSFISNQNYSHSIR
jgi:hypothetical protein